MSTDWTLAKGDIVLITFPFTDLSGQKVRPALVIGQPDSDDILLAFITSRLNTNNPELELLLEPSNPEFLASGLKVASLIRLSKVATLDRMLVRRRLGSIGPETQQSVDHALLLQRHL
ncbi:MAG: type II toxin-antitoxin system PemK/MazF family toxin [Chloroflexia bacterium]|nr:type II toxin-antitoxin system PemK/MazF family toxin [Chloroflexia bacterium]